MPKRMIAVGNQHGFTAIACPKCDTAMKPHEGGCQEYMNGGEVDQREDADWWECPNCGYSFTPRDPEPMNDDDWLHIFGYEAA